MQAMILAAGIGSRLKPLTNTFPKPLIKVNGYTMLEMTIAFLKRNGINEIIINVHHFADKIIEYLKANNNFGVDIKISDERNALMNTGGGIVQARKYFNPGKPFVVMASDILTNLSLDKMLEQHTTNNNLVTLAVKERKTSRKLLFDKNNLLSGWKHNKTGEKKIVQGRPPEYGLAFSGIHIIEPKLFDLVSSSGAFNIINEYLNLAENNPIGAYKHNGDEWLEFGRLKSLEDARTNPSVLWLQNSLNLATENTDS